MRRYLRPLLLLVFTFFAATASLFAQTDTATLTGTVSDSTGAVIPGATVVIRQTATNFTRTVTSGGDGSFRVEFLPIGPYAVKVTAPGFQTLDRSGITLSAMQQGSVTLGMTVGAQTQEVTVTSELPLVNSTNGTVGRIIDNSEVDNLPLVDRNAYKLLNLTAGVQSVTPQTPQNNLGYPEQHTNINGSTDGTVGQVSYYLDGGINMTGLRNTGNILPNPDAIAEFSIQTNNFSAQYGRTSAGIISVVTKSGTNKLHGSIFDFERNSALNASTHNTVGVLPLHKHQFGATIGGPVKKDKLFFFGSYAGIRQTAATPLTGALTADTLQRGGNFSENLPTNSGAITSCTQTIAAADKAITDHGGRFIVCNPVTRLPYAGNIITDTLDPVARNILNQNVPLPTNSVTGQWTGNFPTSYNTDEFLIKMDQNVGNHRFTANYFQTNGNQRQLPSGGNINGWSTQQFNWRQQNANLADAWTINQSTVNQIWFNYSRLIAGRVNLPVKSLADFGSTFNAQGPAALPQIAVGGWFTLSQNIAGPIAGDNVYSVRDLVSYNKGHHNLHFGGEAALEKDAQSTLLNNYGVFAFAASTSARTGNALSDFVLGRPNTMNQDSPVYSNANYWNYGIFAQDDWRIFPRLTLNVGLRYDIQTAPTDTQRRTSNFRQGVQSTAVPNAPRGLLFPGDPGVSDTGSPTQYNHVSPRVGFAYDPFGTGRTVIHGGAGLFFGSIGGNEFELPSNFQPYAVRAQYTKVTSLASPYATDTSEFPGGVSPYPYVYDKANPRFIKPTQVITMDPNYKWPYNYQVNFSVQQQFTKTLSVQAAYVGAFNRKLPLYNDINYPIFNTATPSANTTATSNARRPINIDLGTTASPTYSNVYVVSAGQTANYNALQVTVDKRFGNHFSVNGYYIWSKTINSAYMNNNTLGNTFEDYTLPQLDRQRSDLDVRNQGVMSMVVKPDYYGGHNEIIRGALNGWTVAGIVTIASGAPFNITTGSDNNGDGNTSDRPNLVPGRRAELLSNRTQDAWFDKTSYCGYSVATPTACQGVGPGGSDGALRPYVLNGPSVHNIDLSVFRDFPIYNRVKFQFRAEALNVFNLTNLGAPTGTLSSANFGKITGANGSYPNRQIQLGARILF